MGKAVPARKYGAPLFGAAWPSGSVFYAAGGGGKASSGIKNRVVAAVVKDETTTDEVSSLVLEDCPIRMAGHPSGRSLVLAMSKGGLVHVDISIPGHGGAPVLTLASGDEAERLAKLPVAKCLSFSSDGRLLACCWEDATVTILDWSSARPKARLDESHGVSKGMRDIDFSAAHLNRVLVMASEDGSCTLWDWANSAMLVSLQLPQGLRGGKFSQCRFARNGSLGVFTVVIHQAIGHILYWEQNEGGDVLLKRQVRASADPITSFDMGNHGRCFGIGTTSGEVSAWASQSLRCIKRRKSAHMIFSTAIAVAPDERSVLSVSADAGVVAMSTSKAASAPVRTFTLLAVIVLVLAWYISTPRGADIMQGLYGWGRSFGRKS